MSLSRILYLATTTGIVGYFYQSQSHTQNQQNNSNQLINHEKLNRLQHASENIEKLCSSASARLKEYLYTSALDQWRLNLSEETERAAELVPEEDDDDETAPVLEPIFPFSSPLPIEATRHAMHPSSTRSFYTHSNDLRVYFDTRAKTPFWTVEKINRCNVAAAEHNHGEDFKIEFDFQLGFRFGCKENNTVFSIKSLQVPQVRKIDPVKDECGTIISKGRTVCDFCQQTKLWKTFHEYLRYLTIQHETIHVCSGLLYLPDEANTKGACSNSKAGKLVRTFLVNNIKPSHYFKVIASRNNDGSIRFECYKFKIDREYDKHTFISDYIVSREELEKDLGFTVFETFPQRQVDPIDTRTHEGFRLRQKERKKKETL